MGQILAFIVGFIIAVIAIRTGEPEDGVRRDRAMLGYNETLRDGAEDGVALVRNGNKKLYLLRVSAPLPPCFVSMVEEIYKVECSAK